MMAWRSLCNLTVLDLRLNNMVGTLPADLASACPSLRCVDLHSNSFVDEYAYVEAVSPVAARPCLLGAMTSPTCLPDIYLCQMPQWTVSCIT